MPQDAKTLAIGKLAKYGHFEELCRCAAGIEDLDLTYIFDRAVTDFRTVKRNQGHQKVLQWCIDQGLDFESRAGWLNEPVVCWAAANGNSEIIEYMKSKGLPNEACARTSVGDVEFLTSYASRCKLSEILDENGFNLLFYCAESSLGIRDEDVKRRLTEVCRLLLDQGVDANHQVEIALPVFPAFLCASSGGNEEVMSLLLDHGGLTTRHVHQTLEHSLEPHQRCGEPFYHIAELILERGFDISSIWPDQGRTLLHGAANRGTIKAVKWLLQNGADPNALDEGGRTPLHACAERNNSTAVIKLLIDAGSWLNARDPSGKTPLDFAREHKRTKVVDYLVSISAR